MATHPMKLSRTQFLDHCSTRLPGTMAAFDFADFKRYNDALGHGVGELAIVAFEEILASELKPAQAFARVGGGCWLALVDANGAVQTLTRILDAFEETIERRIGWTASARRGAQMAEATQAIVSSVRRAMRCLYAPVTSPLELEPIVNTLIESCYGFPPGVPVALQDLDRQAARPWRCVSEYPAADVYCPFCRGTLFDWTDGDGSIYGAEGRCRSCHAEVCFSNVARGDAPLTPASPRAAARP